MIKKFKKSRKIKVKSHHMINHHAAPFAVDWHRGIFWEVGKSSEWDLDVGDREIEGFEAPIDGYVSGSGYIIDGEFVLLNETYLGISVINKIYWRPPYSEFYIEMPIVLGREVKDEEGDYFVKANLYKADELCRVPFSWNDFPVILKSEKELREVMGDENFEFYRDQLVVLSNVLHNYVNRKFEDSKNVNDLYIELVAPHVQDEEIRKMVFEGKGVCYHDIKKFKGIHDPVFRWQD